MVVMKSFVSVWIVGLLIGCVGHTEIIKDPNSPMVISKIDWFGNRMNVYILAADKQSLVEYGWVPIDHNLHGMTIYRYDWEKFFADEMARNRMSKIR